MGGSWTSRLGTVPLVLTPSRWLRPFAAATLTAPVVLLAAAAGAAGAAVEAVALQEATIVTVSSFSYSPDPVEIRSGESIRWRWQGDGRHSVTADDGSFDSDPACEDNPLLRENCRTGGGEDFVWTAPGVSERLEIPYHCKLHASSQGMTGTVVVLPPPEPSPSESPARSPSPSPSRSPATSPSPAEGAAGDGDGGDEDRPPSRGPQRGAPPDLQTGSGSDASPPPIAAPEVAAPVDEPDLEPFPSPAPIPTQPATEREDLGEVAVDVPADDDGPLRVALLGVATVAVAGTAVAFGKLVLFGPRWR